MLYQKSVSCNFFLFCKQSCWKGKGRISIKIVIISFYLGFVSPHSGYCTQFWALQSRKTDILEQVQWRGIRVFLLPTATQWDGMEKAGPNSSQRCFVIKFWCENHRKFQLHLRKLFFTMRVAKNWNKLSRKSPELPSLELTQSLTGQEPEQPDLSWHCFE